MLDELRRAALITSGVAELTRHRAEQVVKDLVRAGDVRRDQTSSVVKELLKRSADNRRELVNLMRSEIRNQMQTLGVATSRDLERLERRITRLEDRSREATTAGARAGGESGTKTNRKKSSTAKNAVGRAGGGESGTKTNRKKSTANSGGDTTSAG